jgi:PKD repeat protein
MAPVSESFESNVFPPASWNTTTSDTTALPWIGHYYPDTHCGSFGNSEGCAYAKGPDVFTATRHYILLSPRYNLTGLTNPVLKFDHKLYYKYGSPSNRDTLKVFYTNDCGLNKVYLYQIANSNLSKQWRTDYILIPSSISYLNNIQFGFEYITNANPDFYIDEININSAQVLAINFTSNKINVCVGDTVQFSDISAYNGSTFSPNYQWYFQGGIPDTSSSANPSVVYTAAGSYDVQLIITNSLDTDTLLIPAYINVGNPFSCSIIQNGDTLIAPQGYASYSWSIPSFGNYPMGLDNTFLIQYGNIVYQLTVIDTNGCKLSINDTVNTTYPISSFESPSDVCAGSSIAFIYTSLGGYSAPKWLFPGGSPSSSVSYSPTITYNTPGIYDLTLITYGASTNDTLIRQGYVHVYAVPSAFNIIQSNDTLYALQGFAGYQWYHADNPGPLTSVAINGAINNIVIPPSNGDYQVIVEDTNGCRISSNITVTNITTNLSPISSSKVSDLSIYPNPTSDGVTLSFWSTFVGESNVEIMNILSQVVYRRSMRTDKGLNKIQLSLKELHQDLYLLHLNNSLESFSGKIKISDH